MKKLLPFLFLFGCLASCVPASNGPEPAPVAHTYLPSDADLLNPERGFFTPYELPGRAGFSPVRDTGNTLVHLNIRLDQWRASDLPQEVLDGLDGNFADIRDAGLKAIIRVAYNQGPYPNSEPDASKAWILRHIEQLKPVLQKNGDVIAWAEAGFIGAWGEWHTSTNGLDNLADKTEILQAFLAALPENRMAQVRYPANIIEMYPDPMDAVKARVAHHNDCFLSSETDVGTYERDGVNTIVRDQAYLAVLTAHTPMSGESCAPNPPRSECNSAMREMELLHFSAINEAYHKGILQSWEQGGCMPEIEKRLGYRLALTGASFNEQVRPGGVLALKVDLTNSGFSAPVNPRPLFVVLVTLDGKSVFLTSIEVDPRTWQPGDSSFTVRLRLPSNLAEGQYHLALWLPDEAVSLQNDPRYAIQFANENIRDEKTGYNLLGTVAVDKSAGGSVERSDFLQVIDLSASETVPLPTTTAAPTVTPTPAAAPVSAQISDVQALNNGEAVTIKFAFTGKVDDYNGFQVFLDADQDPATGFSINAIGADFLLENDTLNAYAGTGADWNWSPVDVPVLFDNANQTAQWLFQRGDIRSVAPGLDFVCQLVDTGWNSVFTTQKETQVFQ
jgi:hypothetical protein